MDILGSVALLLAFLAAVYAFVAGIVGIVTRRPLITKSARNAGMAIFGLVILAAACLEFHRLLCQFGHSLVVSILTGGRHRKREKPRLGPQASR